MFFGILLLIVIIIVLYSGYESKTNLSREEAIEIAKNKYPEFEDFPSNSLPPKVVFTQPTSEGVYVAFVQGGSGRPIIWGKCYLVRNSDSVEKTGEYNPDLEDMNLSITPKTCTP